MLLKLETLQHTGSFKFRGAYNRLAQLDAAQRAAGVVAFSSGNHAQGVAAAARLLGIRATIVMPADAPRVKMRNTLALGAEVIEYDRLRESREVIAARLAAERGAVLVPVLRRSATSSRARVPSASRSSSRRAELGRRARRRAGLHERRRPGRRHRARGAARCRRRRASGARNPRATTTIAARSPSGRARANDPGTRSFCDALLAPEPGVLTFEINRHRLAGGLAVSDDEVRAAIAYAARTLKLVVEPGGAVALAAVLRGRIEARGRTRRGRAVRRQHRRRAAARSAGRLKSLRRGVALHVHAESLWLTALPVLLAAAALTWIVSVAKRNVTIVDTLWPLLFVIATATYTSACSRRRRRAPGWCWRWSRCGDCGSRSISPGAISATRKTVATRPSAAATSRTSR